MQLDGRFLSILQVITVHVVAVRKDLMTVGYNIVYTSGVIHDGMSTDCCNESCIYKPTRIQTHIHFFHLY